MPDWTEPGGDGKPGQPPDEQVEKLRAILLPPDRLVERISPVIAEILTEQIQESGDQLAQAISPIIGEAIRRQVYQAREDIVDALYPVIGAMINKALAEAMKDLARSIDQRLRRTISIQDRLRARLRGVSEAEQQLRLGLPFAVQEILLIHRESGLLIHHLSFDDREAGDRDLVSGMLTAIRDFAGDAFGGEEPLELDTIDYETRRILLEAEGHLLVAVVIEGVEPAGFRERIRQAIIGFHQRHYDDLQPFEGDPAPLAQASEELFAPLAEVEPPAREMTAGQRRILIMLAALVLLPPLLLGGWWVWRVERTIHSVWLLSRAPTATLVQEQPATATATLAPTATPRPTETPTRTPSPVPSATASPTLSPSATHSPTPAPTATATPRPVVIPPTQVPEGVPGVMLGNVYLLPEPGGGELDLAIVARLGSEIEILAQYGDWYLVRAPIEPGRQEVGWLLALWVTPLQPLPDQLITVTPAP